MQIYMLLYNVLTNRRNMFVLRNYNLHKNRVHKLCFYRETKKSVLTTIGGVEAVTLFLEHENSAKRAMLLGWKDETELYNAQIAKEQRALERQKKEEKRKKGGRPPVMGTKARRRRAKKKKDE